MNINMSMNTGSWFYMVIKRIVGRIKCTLQDIQ